MMGNKVIASDIDRLLEDIRVRYVEKHADSYVKDLEQALGIKVDYDPDKRECAYEGDFDFCNYARDMQKRIQAFEQQQKVFSVEECSRNFCRLHVIFKFHPENAS